MLVVVVVDVVCVDVPVASFVTVVSADVVPFVVAARTAV